MEVLFDDGTKAYIDLTDNKLKLYNSTHDPVGGGIRSAAGSNDTVAKYIKTKDSEMELYYFYSDKTAAGQSLVIDTEKYSLEIGTGTYTMTLSYTGAPATIGSELKLTHFVLGDGDEPLITKRKAWNYEETLYNQVKTLEVREHGNALYLVCTETGDKDLEYWENEEFERLAVKF